MSNNETIFTFELNHDKSSYCVSRLLDKSIRCAEISAMHNGLPVTRIGCDAFKDCENLIRAVLPEGITEIEENAFSDCINLSDIRLPVSVSRIGAGAFYNCWNLTDINIPYGIKEIEEYTFRACSLREISLPASIEAIHDSAFAHCSTLNRVIVPRNIRLIHPYAFDECFNLRIIYRDIASDTDIFWERTSDYPKDDAATRKEYAEYPDDDDDTSRKEDDEYTDDDAADKSIGDCVAELLQEAMALAPPQSVTERKEIIITLLGMRYLLDEILDLIFSSPDNPVDAAPYIESIAAINQTIRNIKATQEYDFKALQKIIAKYREVF